MKAGPLDWKSTLSKINAANHELRNIEKRLKIASDLLEEGRRTDNRCALKFELAKQTYESQAREALGRIRDSVEELRENEHELEQEQRRNEQLKMRIEGLLIVER